MAADQCAADVALILKQKLLVQSSSVPASGVTWQMMYALLLGDFEHIDQFNIDATSYPHHFRAKVPADGVPPLDGLAIEEDWLDAASDDDDDE